MPSARVSIRDFKGQYSAAFAGALPEGAAQLQVNCDTSKPGQTGPRAGWRRMTYTGGSSVESSQIIGMYRYQTPTGRDVVVYEKANGKLCGADTLTTVADSTATLGAASLSTGWHASRRLCFAKTRFGDLIGVNGLDRGFRWDGVTSATEALGITAPTVAPSIAQAAGGAQTAGTYTFAYRYVDNTLPTPVASSFSPTVTSVATANQKPNWTITTPTEDRVSHIELWRTVAGDTVTFYKVATIADGTTTYTTDTSSDATLQASSDANTLFSENADGSPDASRFTPPPNFMSVVTLFQDRMVYCRGEKYSTGTVTTNGSTTITGSGTAWTSTMAGRYIEISGEPAPLLISAASATSITTSSAATTSASGKTYVVYPDPTYRRKLLYCTDYSTEVLTNRGWLSHDEIRVGDLALSIDPKTEQIIWSPIKSINRFDFDGYMNRWTSSRFDALTTDDHRWLARGCGVMGGHWTLRKGGELKTHFTTTSQSQSMTSKRLIVGGGDPANPLDDMEIDDDTVRLIGWYITDGCNSKTLAAIVIAQSETHNPSYCKELDDLASRFRGRGATATACKPFVGKHGKLRQWYFGKGVGRRIKNLCPNKQITPELLLRLTPRQLKLLYDTMMAGDGHKRGSKFSDGKTDIFSQKDQGRIDGFQMLCAMLGKRSRCAYYDNGEFEMGHVTAYKSQYMTVCKLKQEKEYYKGIVWCPTTETGTWMARRNGCTYWTGNSEQDEPESVPLTNTITLQENTGDDDEITGAHQYGANLFVTTDRHKYRVRWAEQPTIDGIAALIDDRGACNQWCWDVFENVAYVMDDAGIYSFTPDGGSTSISGPIQNLWDANTGERIDFSKKEKFFVQADRPNEKIHFFVCYTTDSGDYPQRRLTYNIRSQTFDPHEYTQQFGGACYWFSSGKTRVVAGGSNEQICLLDEGTTEGVVAHVRGSPTSATSTQITDSGASFPAGIVGAQVAIIDGTGKGQKRIITARTSTTITTAAWTTTPDTTSVYLVGGLEWQWRSKRFEFAEIPLQNSRCVKVAFLPTSGAFWADLRLRFNNDSSPITFGRSQNLGDGVVVEETNQTDAKVHFQQAYSALENAVGFAQFDFSGRQASGAHTDHWVAIDLRGYQGDDVVEIHGIDVQGVN